MAQAARVPNRPWHQPQPRPKNPVGQKEPEPTTSEDHPENIPTNERALCDSGIQRCRQPEKEREKLSDERIDPSSTSSKGKRNLVGPCAQVWGCQCTEGQSKAMNKQQHDDTNAIRNEKTTCTHASNSLVSFVEANKRAKAVIHHTSGKNTKM